MAVMNIKPQKVGGLSSTIKLLLLCIYLLASYRQRAMFTSSITKQMRSRPLSSAYILSSRRTVRVNSASTKVLSNAAISMVPVTVYW